VLAWAANVKTKSAPNTVNTKLTIRAGEMFLVNSDFMTFNSFLP